MLYTFRSVASLDHTKQGKLTFLLKMKQKLHPKKKYIRIIFPKLNIAVN